jgi:antitoxin (DNA-binding transcriptional repressor) of toxin-antitoxin stability system
MKSITMLELRTRSREVVQRLQRGEPFRLTYRRRPLSTLVPATEPACAADDPIRRLHELADTTLPPMTNEEIDQLLYGEPKNLP